MLINALCDYYDVLAKQNKVLPYGYSRVKVNYLVCLTPDGKIDEIIDWQKTESYEAGKGKVKEKSVSRDVDMPKRTEKPGIDANIIEHRPLYIFGLNFEDGVLTPYDKTDKAKKSHCAFINANINFLEGLDSPLANAYRAFIQNWNPEDETENPYLLGLKKAYSSSGYAFCLSGNINNLLHEDKLIVERWKEYFKGLKSYSQDSITSQCAVSGNDECIARIHSKIKGVYGGLATGTVLVGFNNPSENSYGNEQSYNSNISESSMKKYTESLNYLLNSKSHKARLDDITIVFWAQSDNEKCNDLMSAMLFDDNDVMDESQTEEMLKKMIEDAREGNISPERISKTTGMDPNVDFYLVGLKPNSSRIAIKFIYHKRFGEILLNIAKHQSDMQISQEIHTVPLWKIKKEMISPKSKNETVDPALLSKIFESVIYGTPYPLFLLSTMVRRVKTDTDIKISPVRAGVIKACINRNSRSSNQKEELKLALDLENNNPAYLCGRLFAVLEKVQQDASNNSLNRTIKDSYFASASSKPAVVFPKLLKLAQYHINKSEWGKSRNDLIGKIIDKLGGEFPDTLSLTDQGKFIIGYYQQFQDFFVSKKNKENFNIQEEK